MNYCDLISNMTEKVYQNGVATKIIQHMDRIKNASDLAQARRWPMELIQNARDVAYEKEKIKIKIEINDKQLIFSHTGKPFRIKDILSIINQVSGKDSTDDSTIGQFGTGFMTTFQLSPMVEIRSVLKDSSESEELPYKNFSITLDRRGTTKEEILSAIENSIEQLKEADASPEITQFDKNAYNTSFIYHLNTQSSHQIARMGMEDLDYMVLYILLFSEKIEAIELRYLLSDKKKTVVYRRKNKLDDVIQVQGELQTEDIEKIEVEGEYLDTDNDKHTTEKRLLYVKKTININNEAYDICLATEWSKKAGILPLDERTSRIFIDFPLVGSEQFPFPVVMNCRGFKPNEPRNGITLVDKEDSPDAIRNKQIMECAVSLYGDFLTLIGKDYDQHLENMIYIPKWQESKEMSSLWVTEHIYNALYRIISEKEIIETQRGRKKAADAEVVFIQADSQTEKNNIRKILSALEKTSFPMGDECWYEALENYMLPENKIINIEKLLTHEESFLKRIETNQTSAMDWCQLVYDTACENEEQLTRIRAGEVAVFPNQADWDKHSLFTINSIKRDPGIPEILKDVSEQLVLLKKQAYEAIYEIRKELLHLEFKVNPKTEIYTYEKEILTNYIRERSSRKFSVTNFNYYKEKYLAVWKNAWLLMVKCGPNDTVYKIAKIVYGENLGEQDKIEGFDDTLWYNTYKYLLLDILETVAKLKNINSLKKTYFVTDENESGVYEWLNLLYETEDKYRVEEYETISCMPDQEGNFNSKANLKRDAIGNEELKSIIYRFRNYCEEERQQYEIYKRLLHSKITYNVSDMYTFEMQEAASLIGNAVRRALSEKSLSEHTDDVQDACSMLLGWIDSYSTQAEKYFPDYVSDENMMKLLTTHCAVKLKKKSDMMDHLMKECGIDSAEGFSEAVKEGKRVKERNKELESENQRLKEQLAELEKGRHNSEISELDDEVSYINGIGFGDELISLDNENRMRAIREIGNACEKYVYKCLIEEYVKLGYVITSQESGCTYMNKGIEQLKILYPDEQNNGVNRKQPGWDIAVENMGNGTVEYYEVKGHTLHSKSRGLIRLTDEQMKKAIAEGDQYIIALIDYDWNNKTVVRCKTFQNPINEIEQGKLSSYEGVYHLWDKH